MFRTGLVFAFCFLTVLGFSQEPRFKAGLTGGLVASDIPGTDTRDNDVDYNKLGFTLGALVNTRVNDKTLVQLEINYIQKGTEQKPDSNNQGYFKLSLNYIEVPLLIRRRLHFSVFKRPSTNFDLEAGASYGKIFSMAYVDGTNTPATLNPAAFNQTDISLLFGVDYNFNPNWAFCIRYTNSLIAAIKTDPLPAGYKYLSALPYTFNHGDNVVIQFTIKFAFGPGGGS